MKKIIHQSWKTHDIPSELFPAAWVESWTEKNPGWDYRLWTDRDIQDFVRDRYPAFYPVWCSYPKQMMRVDAWRYLALLTFGGLYADLDFFCMAPLDSWLTIHTKFAAADQGDLHLCNAFMWAPNEGEAFLSDIERSLVEAAYERDILKATGPHFLERFSKGREEDLSRIPTHLIYPVPFWKSELLTSLRSADEDQIREHLPTSKAVSFWTGSWVDQLDTLAQVDHVVEGGIGLEKIVFAVVNQSGNTALAKVQKDLCFPPEIRVLDLDFSTLLPGGDLNNARLIPPPPGSQRSVLQEVCKAWDATDYEWVFVCAESTYVAVDRVAGLVKEGSGDLICNESILVEGRPSRKGGYLISRRLGQLLTESQAEVDEADLRQFLETRQLRYSITPLLRQDRFRFPDSSNQIASSNSDDPRYLCLFHSCLHSNYCLEVKCAHQFWRGELQFHESGLFRRAESCDGGSWIETESHHLLVEWIGGIKELFFKISPDAGILVDIKHADHIVKEDLGGIEVPFGEP